VFAFLRKTEIFELVNKFRTTVSLLKEEEKVNTFLLSNEALQITGAQFE
jgi:hypothetical protein